MAVGACVGRIIGMFMERFQARWPELWIFESCDGSETCVTPGTYAMGNSFFKFIKSWGCFCLGWSYANDSFINRHHV